MQNSVKLSSHQRVRPGVSADATCDSIQVDSQLARVSEVAKQRLRDSPFMSLRQLRCRIEGRVLVLEGKVPSFYLKQVAYTLVRDLHDVAPIDDRITVVD